MTPEQLFDEIVTQYNKAGNITQPYHNKKNVFRDRQHSISSVLEDLFAFFLSNWAEKEFPNLPVCFMIDFAIQPDSIGAFLYPDIAIVVEPQNEPPRLVSYLDVKTDLGYKRDYYIQLPDIVNKITRLRTSKYIGRPNSKQELIKPADKLIWRSIILSDKNINKGMLQQNKDVAEQYKDTLKLYFLSGNKHPNRKKREEIKIYNDQFEILLQDISNDIKQN